jgi:hypothetical protein
METRRREGREVLADDGGGGGGGFLGRGVVVEKVRDVDWKVRQLVQMKGDVVIRERVRGGFILKLG